MEPLTDPDRDPDAEPEAEAALRAEPVIESAETEAAPSSRSAVLTFITAESSSLAARVAPETADRSNSRLEVVRRSSRGEPSTGAKRDPPSNLEAP